MSLHFLLKAEARTLSVVQVLAMSDDDAFALFRHLRWGEGEEVVCPHCGMAHRHYFRPTRKIWRCAGCQDDFSVTSGTIFALYKSRKRAILLCLSSPHAGGVTWGHLSSYFAFLTVPISVPSLARRFLAPPWLCW